MSSSTYANNKTKNILVLGKDCIQGINNPKIYGKKCIQSILLKIMQNSA